MEIRATYYLFGFIPILVIVRQVEQEEALYKRLSQRFADEMKSAFARVAK